MIPIYLLLAFALIAPRVYASQPATNAVSGPTITSIDTNLADYPDEQLPRYARFEMTITFNASYTNPFDPDEIRVDGYFTSPTHITLVQPGFYYQAYRISKSGDAETYTPTGSPVWKVRFTPAELGVYEYYLKISDGTGTTISSVGSFEVVNSNNPGFIHVSKVNPRYFQFDNGSPFIGFGLNVAWWQDEHKRISTYEYYLSRMKENQANLARVWMTNSGKDQNWILSIQDKALGSRYNLEEAWAFDNILDLAQKKGVYFILTLDDVNQYTYNWDNNLYNRASGGPCAYRSCIFTNPQAIKYQEQVFRYIIARWGYSPNILSWELFNEIDELQWSDLLHWKARDMVDWHQEAAQYIQSIDAHGHLIDTSTGSFKTHPDLYGLAEMGFAQIHFYYVPGCCYFTPSDPAGRDMADLTRYYSHLLYDSVTNKPAVIGEWGLLDAKWTASPWLKKDMQGVYLHNGLWSSLMSGMAATGLDWNWVEYQAHDPTWWQSYRGIAGYFKGIQLKDLTVMKPVNVNFSLPEGLDEHPDAFSTPNKQLRVMGLRSGEQVYAWIQNKDHTWWNATHGITPDPQSAAITIYNLTPGKSYTIEWWDTYATAEQIIASENVTARGDGSLSVIVKQLVKDVALKIYPSQPVRTSSGPIAQ
jgi:Domain of unknown function (DUF5060)